MSLVIRFYFTSSVLNMFRTVIHPSSGAYDFSIFYCITTLVVCSCFDVCWSFSVAGLVWYLCSSDLIEKSQAPDDGCITVRNMLSIEEVK